MADQKKDEHEWFPKTEFISYMGLHSINIDLLEIEIYITT